MSKEPRSETLYSSALWLKKVTVTEHAHSRGRRLLSGTRLKLLLFPFLHRAIRHAPPGIAMLPVRLLTGTLRLLYRWPGNPLRQSCEHISRIARGAGVRHEPRVLYRQFLANVSGVIENYFLLHRHGIGRIAERIELDRQDAERIRALAERHGGAILAVPHNIASALSALQLNRSFPLLVVARNPHTIARTRVTLEFFECMQVPVLMVRGGNPFELSRNLFAVLKSGRVIAATLDNIENDDSRVEVSLFGQPVGLARWAMKIAVRKQIPVIPCYFSSRGNRHRILVGEAVSGNDIEAGVRQYAAFFEEQILADPASWAYLVDKRWRRVLERGAGELSPHPGGRGN